MTTPTSPATLQSILPGAGVAVQTCMAVKAADRVYVITDEVTEIIGAALAQEALATGATVRMRKLEDFAARPILATPENLFNDIRAFQPIVSFFAASSLPGEVAYRMALSVMLLHELNVRHGHMPGVTPLLMMEGMTTDYNIIHDVTMRVNDIVSVAQTIHVTSPKGTDLCAILSPDLHWVPCHGLYHRQGEGGNLPEGETFTCPGRVDGVLVADILGDYFSEKYGILEQPVTFVVEDSLITDIRSDNQALVEEINAYLDSSENGRRVGEFAVGTNIGLTRLVGNLLQDEKYPGVHVAFGNPYPDKTGANWVSSVHMDVIPTDCTIDVDGRRIMTAGVFAPDILAGL